MIQVEHTPNPNSLKFLSEKIISTAGTEEFQKKEIDKIENDFIKGLLNFHGVELILLSEKFIAVKKNEKISWESLKPMIISHINDFFEKNDGPILKSSKLNVEPNLDAGETIKKIKDVLDTKIRPAVARDGGDIKFVSFNNGVVTVELQGSCSGCPSSLMTLKKGVQNLLCHYVEEVKSVEAR